MMAALIAEPQPYPVFMCCRTLGVGAHHACWLLLQALFITASVPTVTSTTATRTMTKGLFIVISRPGHSLTEFSSFKNELRLNVWRAAPLRRSKLNACFRFLQGSSASACPLWSRTTKHASYSSTDHGGTKRRAAKRSITDWWSDNHLRPQSV